MPVTEERIWKIESALSELAQAQLLTDAALRRLADSQAKTEAELRDFKGEMRAFKDEMRAFKDEMADFKREVEADRKRMNKAWGELANRLGTIVEDIAAPNVRRIAEEELGVAPLIDFICRRKRRRPDGRWSEWDVMAVGREAIVCCEVRSNLALPDVPRLVEKFSGLPECFPEYAPLRLMRMVASWAFEEAAVAELSKHRVYALAMGDDTMELLNRGAF